MLINLVYIRNLKWYKKCTLLTHNVIECIKHERERAQAIESKSGFIIILIQQSTTTKTTITTTTKRKK